MDFAEEAIRLYGGESIRKHVNRYGLFNYIFDIHCQAVVKSS